MQVVIEIDDYLYNQIFSDAEIMIYTGRGCGKTLLATLLRSTRTGTTLPKGHGRLIDADAYRKEMLDSREFDFFKRLDMQPTIIPADKEGED